MEVRLQREFSLHPRTAMAGAAIPVATTCRPPLPILMWREPAIHVAETGTKPYTNRIFLHGVNKHHVYMVTTVLLVLMECENIKCVLGHHEPLTHTNP